MFGGAVSVHGFGLPGEAFGGVVVFVVGVGGYVLDIVESSAASELVSECSCGVFSGKAVDGVSGGSLKGVYDCHGRHDSAAPVGVEGFGHFIEGVLVGAFYVRLLGGVW